VRGLEWKNRGRWWGSKKIGGRKRGAFKVNIPIAKTATCFNLGHLSKVSAEMGILVVITTSASLILSAMVSISDGVERYSVYVCCKPGGKVREGVWMPSKRTIFIVFGACIILRWFNC
jgi:hypothetical protein